VMLLLFALARMGGRRPWVAVAAFAALFSLVGVGIAVDGGGSTRDAVVMGLSLAAEAVIFLIVVIRFGIVAMTAFLLTDFLAGSVMTVQPAVWYAGPSVLNLMLIATLALYGYFRLSRQFPAAGDAHRGM